MGENLRLAGGSLWEVVHSESSSLRLEMGYVSVGPAQRVERERDIFSSLLTIDN